MRRCQHNFARRNGHSIWLWRAVDQDGYVLDEIVQARRDTKAAKRLLVGLLTKQDLSPKRIVSGVGAVFGDRSSCGL
jgi:putative transposase